MDNQTAQPSVWQHFMLVLSVFSLLLIAVQTFFAFPEKTDELLYFIDYIFCGVFFIDFLWQLAQSKPRLAYLKWGWLDLISSLPMLPIFRVARLARIVRIIRVLRGVRASKHLLSFILLHRAKSTFGAVVFGSFILLLVATIAIMSLEPSLTPRDAFWWCLFTLITGEYGDFYPASTEGRIITTALMTAGVAIFGTFTATVASFFLEQEQEEDEQRDKQIMQEIAGLADQISDLKNQLTENKNREAGQ